MKAGKRSRASLRVFSRELTAAAIAARLQTPATQAHERGDAVSRHTVSPAAATEATHEQALWLLESTLQAAEPLDHHIAELTAFAEAKCAEFDQLRSCCEIDLVCAFSSTNGQGGFIIDPPLLQRLARLNISLIVDLYPPHDAE